MKRGELWVARAELYASKVRPVLVVQSDEVLVYDSIITCLVTSYDKVDDRLRLKVEPTKENGLESVSFLMFDKLFSFDRGDMAKLIGRLSVKEMEEVDKRLRFVLGL